MPPRPSFFLSFICVLFVRSSSIFDSSHIRYYAFLSSNQIKLIILHTHTSSRQIVVLNKQHNATHRCLRPHFDCRLLLLLSFTVLFFKTYMSLAANLLLMSDSMIPSSSPLSKLYGYIYIFSMIVLHNFTHSKEKKIKVRVRKRRHKPFLLHLSSYINTQSPLSFVVVLFFLSFTANLDWY